ncbi:MAG: DUF3618 domain-containing protein [Nocardioidaceae bacterium]
MSTAESNGVPVSTDQSPEAIRAEIEKTREELAETVDALHKKVDIKTQAEQKAAEALDHVVTPEGKPRPPVIAVAVGTVALVALLVWRKRH